MDSIEVAQEISRLEEYLNSVEAHCDTELKIYVQDCFKLLYQAKKLNDFALDYGEETDILFMEGLINLLSSMILASERYCMTIQNGTKRINMLLAQAGKLSSQLN